MAYIPAFVSGDTLTFYINHKAYQVDASFPGFEEIKAELRKGSLADPDRMIALSSPAEAISSKVAAAVASDRLPAGVVSVTRDEIRFNGEVIEGVLVDRILSSLAEGFDIMPMVRFMENLFQNPAPFARDELYLWLETSNLPITEDGHFLAYKNVNQNYTSIHDGKTDNTPGKVVSMDRASVDPNRHRTCSAGLHFCSKDYLPHFYTSGARTVLLKINPADVVSIPSDYKNTKGRAWQYLVLEDVNDDPQTKVWPAVVNTAAPAPAIQREPMLVIGSDLAKSLFAACNEIGLTERQDRLDWATDELFDLGHMDTGEELESFNDLTVKQASALLDKAHALKAAADAQVGSKVRQAQVDAINSYGIVTLRKLASQAGMRNAWKGQPVAALRAYLISKL
jgi:hypothetical protein